MRLQILFRAIPVRLFALGVALLCLTPHIADAQYFGRNKVQYRTFDFQVLQTEHFDIYYYPEAEASVAQAARLAERWYARLSKALQHELVGRQPLILYAAHPHFQQTNVLHGEPGEATGGATEIFRRRIVMPVGGSLIETDHVLGHELVHAFQFDITARAAGMQAGIPGAMRLPLWFVEGMAEYLSLGPVDPFTAMWMRDAARQERLPRIRQLDDPRYFPYRWGHAFWAYVGGRFGDARVGELLRAAGATGNTIQAIETVLGISEEELSEDWHRSLRESFRQVAGDKPMPGTYGRLLVHGQALGGDINVAPAMSPDGRWVAFFSERDLFSINLFLADTETGRVERLVQTALDPHFSSLQFANSAGGWRHDGGMLAFAAIRAGRATLGLYDVERRRIARHIEIEGVDEVFNPTWSPDGGRVAFAALAGGFTNLYIYDFQTESVRQLTDDAFAALQPSWSPDGRRIAFITDRFSTRLEDLTIGTYEIAFIEPDSGRIERGPGFEGAKNLNPQWSADGRSLFFVSDRNGIANIYRFDFESGQATQVTDLATGVGGITGNSPALSVARRADRMAFTAYEDGEFRIYAVEDRQVLAGGTLVPRPEPDPALLPPHQRPGRAVVAPLLAETRIGLPTGERFTVSRYRPALGLDFVSQPTVAVGVDRFGTFAGGGVALLFSDMLGDHNLVTAIQANSTVGRDFSFNDIGGLVGYQNQRRRMNWGGAVQQVPYLSGGFRSRIGTVGGQPALIEESIIFREVNRDITGIAAYPFSRAQRIEFMGGYRNIAFDQEVISRAFSLTTGRLIAEDRTSLPAPESLHLGQAAAALVYDTSIFGATSPIAGQRYRLEASPLLGTLSMTTLLADYRRYLMPVSFYTIAGRVMHYGRYGPDAEDPRLFPLFIGYPNLVRGYDVRTLNVRDDFERLLGSRMLVGNLEFRFPLLRPFGVRQGMYGPVPIEVALFADAGVAWDREDRPTFLNGNRRPVTSAGVTLRANALGFAIVQFDIARPFQRPEEGWVFQFSFVPGF
jgi:Tol biopolymer transport system component